MPLLLVAMPLLPASLKAFDDPKQEEHKQAADPKQWDAQCPAKRPQPCTVDFPQKISETLSIGTWKALLATFVASCY